jgi:hypothetical protein
LLNKSGVTFTIIRLQGSAKRHACSLLPFAPDKKHDGNIKDSQQTKNHRVSLSKPAKLIDDWSALETLMKRFCK